VRMRELLTLLAALLAVALHSAPASALTAPQASLRAARTPSCRSRGLQLLPFSAPFSEPDDPSGFFQEHLSVHQSLQAAGMHFGEAHEVLAADESWRYTGKLYVLLSGEGEEEGVYTLMAPSRREECFVLAFVEADQAERFALQLEAEDFELLRYECWPADLLLDFCDEAGLMLGLVPEGELILPPSDNAYTELPDNQDIMPITEEGHVEMVAALERIYSMERTPEVNLQLQRMLRMRRPRVEEDSAVNWPMSWGGE